MSDRIFHTHFSNEMQNHVRSNDFRSFDLLPQKPERASMNQSIDIFFGKNVEYSRNRKHKTRNTRSKFQLDG